MGYESSELEYHIFKSRQIKMSAQSYHDRSTLFMPLLVLWVGVGQRLPHTAGGPATRLLVEPPAYAFVGVVGWGRATSGCTFNAIVGGATHFGSRNTDKGLRATSIFNIQHSIFDIQILTMPFLVLCVGVARRLYAFVGVVGWGRAEAHQQSGWTCNAIVGGATHFGSRNTNNGLAGVRSTRSLRSHPLCFAQHQQRLREIARDSNLLT
jgi:hypothetical protein